MKTKSSLTFLSLGGGLKLQYLSNFKDVNNLIAFKRTVIFLKVKHVLKSFVAYESQKAAAAVRQER